MNSLFKYLVLISVFMAINQSIAQRCELTLHVTDEWNENVAQAHIYFNNQLLAITDESGKCSVKIDCDKKIMLRIKHMSYVVERFEVYASKNENSFRKLIVKRKSYELGVKEIKPGNNLDTIVGENQYYVEDYIFKGDSLILLLKERKSKNYYLRLSDVYGTKIYETTLKGKPLKLFKDALKTNFLVYENQVFSVDAHEHRFHLEEKNFVEFQDIAKYLNHVDDAKILANNKINEKPWFEYYMLDRRLTKNDTLVSVKNEFLYEQYHSEFKFLSTRDRYALRVLEYETGISKYDLAAYYTNFSGNIWYKPAKALHFYFNESHYFFNLCNDSLVTFDKNGAKQTQALIDFTSHKGFTEQIIMDDITGDFYALFLINGKLSLHKILEGKLDKSKNSLTLNMKYPKNIKVNNGKVWYLSRPFESWQSTYLYSEAIAN
jgi:hypothetical protein